jgi:type I restriction enzyme R subunit
VQFGDELITIEEYVKRLFGELPKFLDGADDLRERWANPETRKQLLDLLEQSGFPEEKLNLVRRFLNKEDCDMLDVLSYLAYNTTTLDRQRRADILRAEMQKTATKSQQDFANFILKLYVDNGFKELDMDKLPTLIDMKYHSISDARQLLGMDPKQIRNFFLDFQHELYNGPGVNAATA